MFVFSDARMQCSFHLISLLEGWELQVGKVSKNITSAPWNRVRNLKFATYLKFAASGNTNKRNELKWDMCWIYSRSRLFELKNTKFKKHNIVFFFIELSKVFQVANFRFLSNFTFLTLNSCYLHKGGFAFRGIQSFVLPCSQLVQS